MPTARDFLWAMTLTLISIVCALCVVALVDVVIEETRGYDGPIYAPIEPAHPHRKPARVIHDGEGDYDHIPIGYDEAQNAR